MSKSNHNANNDFFLAKQVSNHNANNDFFLAKQVSNGTLGYKGFALFHCIVTWHLT